MATSISTSISTLLCSWWQYRHHSYLKCFSKHDLDSLESALMNLLHGLHKNKNKNATRRELVVTIERSSVWMHLKIGYHDSCSFFFFLNTSSNSIKSSPMISIDIYLYWKKGAIIVIFNKIKTKNGKIHYIQKKIFDTQGLNMGRLGTSSPL